MTTTPPREQLPPLPDHSYDHDDTYLMETVKTYTADQMQAYAREALRAQAASVEAVVAAYAPNGDGVRPPFDPGPMGPAKAAYFIRRFKHEEKLLGPNEQASLDYVLALLEREATPAHIPADVEPYGQVTTHSVTGQHFFYRWPQSPYLDTAKECVTVWARPPQAPQAAGDVVAWAVWWGVGDMRPLKTLFDTEDEAERNALCIKSHTEVRPVYAAKGQQS